MATNEELARRIQAGERELLPDLWEAVRRFVYKLARRWCNEWNRPGLEPDDLAHSAFLAICESIGDYDPEQGSFLTWLRFPLLTAFSEEVGCRTPAQLKRPENQSESLSSPVGEDLTLSDMLEDPAAEEALEAVEEDIFHAQLAETMERALADLPQKQQAVLRGKYYRGMTMRAIAAEMGCSSSGLAQYERRGLYALSKNKDLRELHHGSRNLYREVNLYRHTSLRQYLADGYSVEEYVVLLEERMARRYR